MMEHYMAIDKTIKDKLTDSEKKKIKQENPKKAEAKKEKKEEGTTKSFT